MAVTYVGRSPTPSGGAASAIPDYVAGTASGDLELLLAGDKSALVSGAVATPGVPAGWSTGQTIVNGTTAAVNGGGGSVRTTAYSKTSVATESGTVSVTIPAGTGNQLNALIFTFRKTGTTWVTQYATGTDATTGTGTQTVTCGSTLAFTVGDWVLAIWTVPDNATLATDLTSPAVTVPGCTLNSGTGEASLYSNATGGDAAIVWDVRQVSAGTATGAPAISYGTTVTTNGASSVIVARISESSPVVTSAPPVIRVINQAALVRAHNW